MKIYFLSEVVESFMQGEHGGVLQLTSSCNLLIGEFFEAVRFWTN
jgi:hypothetical protein